MSNGGRAIVAQASAVMERDGSLDGGPVLDRVGRELAGLAETVDHLQIALSDQVMSLAAIDPELMRSFQAIDALAQMLVNLGRFTRTLASGTATIEADAFDRALRAVSVAALKARLSAEPAAAAGEDDDHDFHLF